MKLEELKEKWDSELQQKVITLESEIEYLKTLNKEHEKALVQLQNRCWVHSQGMICMFCGFKNTCDRWVIK